MSLAGIVCVQEGIVLSADSRTLFHGATSDLANAKVLTDAAFKLHLLWGAVAVTSCGDGHVGSLPVATHLAQLEGSRLRPATTKEAANALLAHIRALSPTVTMTLWVAAHEGTTPFVYRVSIAAGTIERIAVANDGTDAPVFYCDWMGGRTNVEMAIISTLMRTCPPVLERMTLKDAVEFSRHMLRAVIDQTRFAAGIAPVGGPIDTLVLTPHGAGWVVRKQ